MASPSEVSYDGNDDAMQLKTNGNNKRKNDEPLCMTSTLKNTQRELREKAYSEIAEHFDSTSASVKTKINALRAQLGREIGKESKTKSGQATSEQYISKWVFYDQLQFLRSVMASSKSRDSISVYDTGNGFDDAVGKYEEEHLEEVDS